jgi:3-oxoacyl-[acyl-carrier protein] reductase
MNKKVAIITGAGRGIGRGIASQLSQSEWIVVITDAGSLENQEETLDLVRSGGSDGLVIPGDITIAEDRKRIVEMTIKAFGRIDLLVNNAGVGPRVRMDMLEMPEESMREVMNVNLFGTFFLTQVVANYMMRLIHEEKMHIGKIINIGSISAYTSSTSRAEYCISKAAVSMTTTLFADRLAEEKINVFEIRPGIIRTPMTETVKDKYDKLIAEGITPIKRWGEPEDIGKAVLAIAEDYFPFSTGQVFNVDGGFHIKRL